MLGLFILSPKVWICCCLMMMNNRRRKEHHFTVIYHPTMMTSLYCDISPYHDGRPWYQNNKLEVAFEEYHKLLSNITIHMALVKLI